MIKPPVNYVLLLPSEDKTWEAGDLLLNPFGEWVDASYWIGVKVRGIGARRV